MPLFVLEFLFFVVPLMLCISLIGLLHKHVSAAIDGKNYVFFYLWFVWFFLFGAMGGVFLMALLA